MEHKEYNGWFNYETWLVNLWLSNDQDSYGMVRDLITDLYSDRAVFDLADSLKEYVEEFNPLADEANLYSDMINAAICEVNFDKIAEHWIEDYRSDNPNPDKADPSRVYEYEMFIYQTIDDSKFLWSVLEPDDQIDVDPTDSFWGTFNNIVADAHAKGMKHIVIEWEPFMKRPVLGA